MAFEINEQNYVDKAEEAIKKLMKPENGRRVGLVTTSQIRNILAMTADIYNDVVSQKEERLPEETVARINYLKVRLIYEAGRTPSVKQLVETANLLDIIKGIGASRARYLTFSRYMEALVAFRKFYGPEEH